MLPPFVDPAWLIDHRNEVVLADVRFYLDGRPPRAAYDAGHLADAVYVDLERWLSGSATAAAGRHPLPTAEIFAEGMGRIGVDDATPVVAYDDAGGVIAARLVWMLRAIGHPAALLDGGWEALEHVTAAPAVNPATFSPRPWPRDLLADPDELLTVDGVVIDARPYERFLGTGEDAIDPRRGHIPGARSVPTREHVGAYGRLLPIEALRRRFRDAGVDDDTAVVSTCGSGVTACHNLLVLEHAGFRGRHRLYPGSWSQWSADPDRPVETGVSHETSV